MGETVEERGDRIYTTHKLTHTYVPVMPMRPADVCEVRSTRMSSPRSLTRSAASTSLGTFLMSKKSGERL